MDALAKASNLVFEDKRYGAVTTLKVKNQTLTLLKPSTYMNLSGNAVRYWMNEKKIPLENILVVVDDLSLPFGQLRMRPGGSEARSNTPACALASATISRAADRLTSYWESLPMKTSRPWTNDWNWPAKWLKVSRSLAFSSR